MKKHLHNSLRALFLSLAVLLSLPMLAEQVEIDGINYELVAKAKQATVIKKSSGKYSGEIVIPESVEHEGATYSVTSIGYRAFYGCKGLTSVTIPNSVTSIGAEAFYNCRSLTSVTIPNSVTYIGTVAFGYCSGLTSVIVENGNLVYDSRNNCNAIIETVTNTLHSGCKTTFIPNSVTSIGDYAFSGCSGLTSVTIPNSVTSIGGHAFLACSGLTSVNIPNSVTNIGEPPFIYCGSLTSIVVEDGNPVYDSRNNCNAIIETATNTLHSGCKTTIIPNSVTSIGDYAFYECRALISVTIPNSVESIGVQAFAYCSGLTSVTIPNSVTSIENGAFAYCKNLLDVYCYAEDVPSAENNTFEGSNLSNAVLIIPDDYIDDYKNTAPWSSFSQIVPISDFLVQVDGINYEIKPRTKEAIVICKSTGKYSGNIVIPESIIHKATTYRVTSIGEKAFFECGDLTSVTIPNSVTSIGDQAFSACSGLTSVNIPNSVTSIGEAPFSYCGSLTSIVVEDGNPVYDSRNNCNAIIETATNTLLSGCKTTIIPNSVTSIGDYAFYYCSGLASVTIPNSVTSIGKGAFIYCSGLTSVTIPNSVTSIGVQAFAYCSGLTSVTIPNSVTNIGGGAFWLCSGLTSIVVEDGNTVYDSRNNCNAIIETATNTLHSGCKTTIIPNSVTSIGEGAFFYCSGLTSVTIPNSVTSIGVQAFAYCSGLTSVTIPNSVENIGEKAFADCPNLLDVYCNAEKVPSTNSDAFEDSYIESITLHVPKSSVESYKTTEPWSGFGRIVALGTESEKEPSPWDLVGRWTMTTASGDIWNVTVRAASKDDPDYNNVLYVYGMMGYNWTKLKMHYSYNYDEGKPEVYVKATEMFAEGVNFGGIFDVYDVYLYNRVGNSLTTADFTATVSTEGNTMTIDFGESTFTGALFSGGAFTGYVWFSETCVKMTRVIPNEDSGETDIVNVEADPVIVQANGGVLSVSGVTEGTRVAIYTLSGTMVGSTNATNGTATINTSLPSGTIVIVRFGNKSVKVRI